MTHNQSIFAPLFIAATTLFIWSCYRRLSLIALGTKDERYGTLGSRIGAAFNYAFAQKRVLSRPFGVNHAVIFWAFLVLAVANGEFLLHGIFPGIALAKCPPAVYGPLVLAFDLVSLLALVAVGVAVVRRSIAPPYEGARTGEAFAILGMIALLMLAFFGMHGAEIALGAESGAGYMPVSRQVAATLSGFAPATVQQIGVFSWWLHGLVLLAFMNYLPYSKHMHILTAIPNCFLANPDKPNTQPREEFVAG